MKAGQAKSGNLENFTDWNISKTTSTAKLSLWDAWKSFTRVKRVGLRPESLPSASHQET
jgi:hypothetical protein